MLECNVYVIHHELCFWPIQPLILLKSISIQILEIFGHGICNLFQMMPRHVRFPASWTTPTTNSVRVRSLAWVALKWGTLEPASRTAPSLDSTFSAAVWTSSTHIVCILCRVVQQGGWSCSSPSISDPFDRWRWKSARMLFTPKWAIISLLSTFESRPLVLLLNNYFHGPMIMPMQMPKSELLKVMIEQAK